VQRLGRAVMTGAAALTVLLIGSVTAQQTGSFTDSRDKQTYKTVKIGKQTWMAQNLNYQTSSGSWCYEDSISYCKKYGRLYDCKTAATVCPKGWKLPDTADWNRLVATAGGKEVAGKKLKSKSGWNNLDDGKSGNGTDDYGFSALPAGRRFDGGDFRIAGKDGSWWTATEYGGRCAYPRYMYYEGDLVDEYDRYNRMSNGYSVRCVADN
jgi:uncharacterized protein (TIGR02145 family)